MKTKRPKLSTAVAACLFLAVLICIAVLSPANDATGQRGGTLQGAAEIYPSVMVNGRVYRWQRLAYELPGDSVYYGELRHVTGETPSADCEFVSVFGAAGEIYTVPGDDESVYVRVTTEWIEDMPVLFSRSVPTA